MTEGIIIALITGGLAIISNFIVAIMNSRLMIYRIEQLEKKVEKHNNLVERVVTLEKNSDAQWRWIDEFKAKM